MRVTLEQLVKNAFAKAGLDISDIGKSAKSEISQQKEVVSFDAETNHCNSSVFSSVAENEDFSLSEKRVANESMAAAKSISLEETSKPCWRSKGDSDVPKLKKYPFNAGSALQCWTETTATDNLVDREIVLGLDFGTSAVKAVLGDIAIKQAFAVQFMQGEGITSYLLPCRLYQSGDKFSLLSGDSEYSNLKLDLIDNPHSSECQERVTAFLSFVIRQVRAWFFDNYNAVYKSRNIVWALSIGLPSENHFEHQSLVDVYKRIGEAAWLLSSSESYFLSRKDVATALRPESQLMENSLFDSEYKDVFVSVVPEIAAQIYGYVDSERFDKNKVDNYFMMVDIGAGTVDVSAFHVKMVRGGRLNFGFFTTTVRPYGVVNLHRARLNFWRKLICSDYAERKDLVFLIDKEAKRSDFQESIPASFLRYFTDSTINSLKEDVDEDFYRKVFEQVFSNGYTKLYRDGYLTKESIIGMPVYLCGGGSRHPVFQKLTNANDRPGLKDYSLRVEFKKLTKPKNFHAADIDSLVFDRLSVAYGLSFMNIKNVVKVEPCFQNEKGSLNSYRDYYIDK